jgi:quercetin dioxygenase-like cupin family protein
LKYWGSLFTIEGMPARKEVPTRLRCGWVKENVVSRMSQPIQRKEILAAVLNDRLVTSARVHEIRMRPGQHTGRHVHPCAVLGYVVEGTAVYKIEGQATQTLPAGSAFYEPADAVIADFGNASESEPMTFIAFYLLSGEQELIRILN